MRLIHRWEVEPDLGASWLYVPTLPEAKLEASRFSSLQRQFRLNEAQAAVRLASRKDLIGGPEALAAILDQLNRKEDNRQVRLALTSAAIALSDGSQARALWDLVRQDNATRSVVECALVGWKSDIALDTWRQRLSDSDASLADLLTAVEGVALVGGSQDLPLLEVLLRTDRLPIPVKIVVARSMGRLTSSGLEKLAEEVLASDIEHRELPAVELISHHAGDLAEKILLQILQSENLPAKRLAYDAIAENFPPTALELAADMLRQPDNNIRLRAVTVFNRFDDAESVKQQAFALGDDNLEVAATVRRNLVVKSQRPELKALVDEVITYQLSNDNPRGIQQAIILAVALQEKERCPQLASLLEHPHVDVGMHAAWALQELVDAPEVLATMLVHAQEITRRLQTAEPVYMPEFLRACFLFEAFGRNRYEPALSMLKIYIPKNDHRMGDITRTSAIWAVGKIMTDSRDAKLATEIAQRMLDPSVTDPEDPLVKFTSALALGWIKAPDSPEDLRASPDGPPSPLGLARDWSLQQYQSAQP